VAGSITGSLPPAGRHSTCLLRPRDTPCHVEKMGGCGLRGQQRRGCVFTLSPLPQAGEGWPRAWPSGRRA